MHPITSLKRAGEVALPGGARAALDLAAPDCALLTLTGAAEFEPAVSYASIRSEWPEFSFKQSQAPPGLLRVETSELTIEITADPFAVKIVDKLGNLRLATVGEGVAFQAGRTDLFLSIDSGEALYGLGEQGENFNRNPGRYRIWNTDDPIAQPLKQYYCGIPFAVRVPGGAALPHGLFLDNPGEVVFDVALENPEQLRLSAMTGDLRLWLFFKDTPAEILGEYTALTGRMERPPLWSLGYQQCRWSYMSADRVREVAGEMRRRRIPCDVLYCDIDYMDRYRVFTWNPHSFGNPEETLKELAEAGFRVVCIVDPGVAKMEEEGDWYRRAERGWPRPGDVEEYTPYEIGMKTEGFFLRHSDGRLVTETVWPGEVHMPDFTHPDTRTLWGEWQARQLLEKGIAGIWNDMNEPAVFADKGFTRDFPADAVHHDGGLHRTHRRLHNIYGMTMAQASCEGQRRHRPGIRPFTLTRSGWAGVQRYSALWTGDNQSSFASMVMDLQLNLSVGMSGVPFVGCDIGGFAGNAGAELFVRWFEWGIFQPFCRGHSAWGTMDHEPWTRGPAAEKLIRRAIGLRYMLLPYVYTQFVEASQTGIPVNRPLALEYPHDAAVASIGDQFLVGPDIMAAPILQAGKRCREVYLPAGEWVHFWSGKRHQGGTWILAESPLGQMPLYVRAGAVIPMHPVRQNTAEPEPEETFLDIWPAAVLSGRLVEDDGLTEDYKQGAECRTLFAGSENSKELHLSIGAPEGSYQPARRTWILRLHQSARPVERIVVEGEKVPFEKHTGMTTARIPATNRPVDVRAVYGG